MKLRTWMKADVNSALFVGSLVLGAWLAMDSIDIAHKERDLADLTGRLATLHGAIQTCRGNVTALSASVDQQNAAISSMSTADAARLKAAQDTLATVLKAQQARDGDLLLLLAPLTAATTCERYQEVDRRLQETLK